MGVPEQVYGPNLSSEEQEGEEGWEGKEEEVEKEYTLLLSYFSKYLLLWKCLVYTKGYNYKT